MSEAKHTEGPWTADDGDGGVWGVFSEADSDGIAYLAEPTRDMRLLRPDEAAANARLIAAAPDLLQALKSIVSALGAVGHDGWHSEPVHESDVKAALAAITKARESA